jgi:hypothetical protein
MRRTVAHILLALACAASHAACTRTGSGDIGATAGGVSDVDLSVDSFVPALKAFTEELASKVESAADTRAGVAEAQRLLDARKAELAARVAALKKSPAGREPAAHAKLLEAEVDNTQRVRDLRLKYLDASLRDPELKAGLERLVADYDSIFKDR